MNTAQRVAKWRHTLHLFMTRFALERMDSKPIPDDEELLLFVVERNESLRLPYFLQYYFNKGVDRVFIIDNYSTDNSLDIALSFDKTHVFRTSDSYLNHWLWVEYLLSKYGRNNWCMVADVDELFFYPHGELLSIKELIRYLEPTHTALRALLLDLYSNKPISHTCYQMGDDPLQVCPFFDSSYSVGTTTFFDRRRWQPFEGRSFSGGVRQRVFGNTHNGSYHFNLSKVPLFKNTSDVYLAQGMHGINGAKISDIQGVVFHTKFMQDFIQRVPDEVKREEHYMAAVEYKIYHEQIKDVDPLCLYDKNSVRFVDSSQLVELGLMRSTPEFDRYASSVSRS
jgi:hypothetical protein